MQPHIPEEIEAMAFLMGQSAEIDSMIIDRPVGLNTNSHTIKNSINQYVTDQRRGVQPPPIRPEEYQQYDIPQPQYIPPPMGSYGPPQSFPQVPQHAPMPQYPPQPKVDDGQLEFNLTPSKADEIIILLKEISSKLTKQNNLLEKQYATHTKEKGISTPVVKLRPNS